MKRIYVAFGNFVVQYEIKKTLCTQCVETKRIQVQITVLGITKTTDGFFTANESQHRFVGVIFPLILIYHMSNLEIDL